ncbi:MAG: S1 RNA-binding domain-containing protein [Asgard group archaeon]|nr:S1 RNA-binding domain-containing protein [Asgard group archaeon]
MTKAECSVCKGTGNEIISEKTCPDCKGMGSTKIVLSSYSDSNANKCKTCHGTGSIITSKKCTNCDGKGSLIVCDSCGKPILDKSVSDNVDICQECKQSPIVFVLKPPCTSKTVNVGTYYHGSVKQFKDFGVFVELFPGVEGLIRNKNLKGLQRSDVGKKIIVYISSKTRDGKIELTPVKLKDYRHGVKRDSTNRIKISTITRKMENKTVLIQGKVSQIKKTSGPISYNFTDETGSIAGAAFIKPREENPYQKISVDDIVEVVGIVNTHRDVLQIEILDMIEAGDEETKTILERIEKVLDERSEPPEVNFLVKDPILEKMKKDLRKLAKMIRRAIFDGTPILIRHHADTDGVTGAVALEQAIIPLIMEEQEDAVAFKIKRSPSKSPFWDFIDVTKDVDFALQDAIRFGDKLPFVILLDLGSSHESLSSIKKASLFGLNIAVLDHHFPEEIVKKNVSLHVNPYYYDGDYNLCSGMLGVELARIVNPDVSDRIDYIAAIAGVADHVEGKTLDQYLALAKKRGLDIELISKIALAVDFEQYFLRFSDGKNIVDSIYGFDDLKSKSHLELVDFLYNEAQTALDSQLEICLAHLKEEELKNNIILGTIDVENFAKKFEFPPPGKTTGAVHDTLCLKYPDKGIVTLGIGPDFVVLRSKGVLINFPKIIKDLKKKIPQAGADGGGHEVVGSVKFIEGMQKEVLEFLRKELEKMLTE